MQARSFIEFSLRLRFLMAFFIGPPLYPGKIMIIKVKCMPVKQGLIRTFAQNSINIIRRVRPV